jgi:O-antigen ligase
MFSENLLFGVGIDNWHISKPTYATDGLMQLEAVEGKDWGAHSYFLKVLSELGLIGYTLFFLAVVVPIKQAHYYISKYEINSGVWVAIASLSVYFIFVGSVSAISKPLQASWFLLIGISSAAAVVAKSD